MAEPDIKVQIAGEIYTSLERLDAEPELLSIIGSWRDTLSDDEEVLALLREHDTSMPGSATAPAIDGCAKKNCRHASIAFARGFETRGGFGDMPHG